MEVEKVLFMNKGDGHTSYATNSLLQRTVTERAGPVIEESAREVYVTLRPECLMMADMGCSSGRNALEVVSKVIDVIDKASRDLNLQSPQFGVFLNDLPGNDFNALFNLLPSFNQELKESKGSSFGHCFVSGTPKSFYGQVFPNEFLHFVHSTFCLHWLSQVPSGLVSETGEPLNKGNICIAKTSPVAVYNAYKAQFQRDFALFLKSRSKEMVSDGRMVLIFPGSFNSDDPDNIVDLLASALRDMVLKGVIESEKLDKFDMPFYNPTVEEVRQLVEAETSFAIHKLERFTIDWSVDSTQDMETRTKVAAKTIRAATEPLLETTFPLELMDDLFRLFETRIKERIAVKNGQYVNIVISVTKKK